eukprot:TRINITY_DN65896_c7_g1_i1.p1 TRINITY_DN65896_c7_g1~~TRINITY_DN65896_c7_g1_i1.p1  ORF type:complete len:424 (+),score=184.93 TRINITY_DN65896_c7_g1_i1:34-1305(+)
MKKANYFTPDTRNLGGRMAVIESMLRHQSNLRRIEAMKGHSPKKQTQTQHQQQQQQQRRKKSTARSSMSSGGSGGGRRRKKKSKRAGRQRDGMARGVDCTPPFSSTLAQSVSKARKRREKKEYEEHLKRLRQLQQRIEQYPTPAQRMKNPYDAVAHPAILIRYTNPTQDDYEFNYAASPKKSLFYSNPFRPDDLLPVGSSESFLNQTGASEAASASASGSAGTSPLAAATRPKSAAPSRRFGSAASPAGARPASAAASKKRRSGRPTRSMSRPQSSAGRAKRSTNGSNARRPRPGTAGRRRRRAPLLASSSSSSASASARRSKRNSTKKKKKQNGGGVDPQEQQEQAMLVDQPYLYLKQHLFNLIVEHRIYRERDLDALFNKARSLNTHLDIEQVNKVLEELRRELDMGAPADQQKPVATALE